MKRCISVPIKVSGMQTILRQASKIRVYYDRIRILMQLKQPLKGRTA